MDLSQQQLSVEDLLKDATEIACSCGNEHFVAAINLKKVSALISPTKREEIAQVGVLICSKCGLQFERPKIISL
jgi:hypothetical protein